MNDLTVPSARVALPDVRRMVSGNHRAHGDIARHAMLALTESYLAQDIPVVIEVVCKSDYIAAQAAVAVQYGATFSAYYLHADEEVRWRRVCERTAEMMVVETLPKLKLNELEPIFTHNQEFYSSLEGELGEKIDTTKLTIDEVIARIK